MQRLAERPGLALLVVVGVAAALDLFGIRERILIVGDESLYAAAAREMLERADWLVPSFNYQPRYQKPILIYWLIGASYQLFGVSEAAARLPSAVFGSLLCALVFALGRKLADTLTGLAAGLVMATSVATVGLSRAVMTDVILCAFTTAAITGFVFAESERERGGSGRWPTLLACVALAGGLLTKGPVAVLIPALVWLPWLAWRGALGRFLRRRELWIGAALFALLAAPWFIAVHLRTQGAFTRHALGYETLERFFGEAVSSASLPWWGYLATLWPAFFPWSAFLPSALIALLGRARRAAAEGARDPLAALAVWWAAVVFVFFSLGATRVVTYTFPAFPALALLIGRWWSLALARPDPRRALSPLPPLLALLAALLGAIALLALPEGPRQALPEAIVAPLQATLAAFAAGFAGICALAWLRPAREVLAALVALSVLAFGGVSAWLMPRVEALEAAPAKAYGEWLRERPEVRALAFDDHALSVYFYAQRPVERFGARESGRFRAAFEAGGPAAAVVRNKHRALLAGLDHALLGEDDRHVFIANAAWRTQAAARGPDRQGLRLASAEASVEIDSGRFGLRLRDAAGRVLVEQAPLGLAFEQGGPRKRVRRVLDSARLESGRTLLLRVETEGGEGELRLRWRTPRALDVEFVPPAGASEITHFSDAWRLAPGEAIYGLTERNADSPAFFDGPPMGEIVPREVGTLDRRGETIEMLVRPTVALYAPFYVSSAGYGLYVATTAPGSYDVGDGDPDALRLRFEAVGPAGQRRLRYSLFVGAPADVLDEYTRLTGRPFEPPEWAFRHWRWRGELAVGAPAELDGAAVNAELAEDLRMYERFGIPAGVYLIDRPWSEGEFGFENFRWDEKRLPNPAAMLAALARRGWRLALWSAAFAVGENLETARAKGYLAPGSDLVLDLTNPEARAWWKREHVAFARRWNVAAIKLDRGEEEIPSRAADVWFDGRNGRELRNAYPVLQLALYEEILREARGDDFLVIARAGYAGAQRHGAAWGGDIPGRHFIGLGPGTDLGLRSAILGLLRAGFLGWPIWGSDTGGYYEFTSREVFARWLEFSAFCPIMEIGGIGAHAPWNMPDEPRFDEELIEVYRSMVQLHHDLIPYVREYARIAAQRGLPIARPLVIAWPDDPRVRDLWDQYLYGDDLLVAPVWREGAREREVFLPPGGWEDFWDATRNFEGPVTLKVSAPLGRIPVFVRAGAHVPGRP
jgi:alpha-glucosidase (family GH31 glycosyl hydrolase)/4-amino-4-deoxy-L-arabinose transferase-like glycosyltransferase